MKLKVALKGEKISAPLHVVGEKEHFWSSIIAPDNGVVVSLDNPTEKLSGGVFITEDDIEYIRNQIKQRRLGDDRR
jgi:hypothetical protein